jgi:polyvinyl alcohol dehydrogenase (cytochrome)
VDEAVAAGEAPQLAAAGEWPMYGHDLANTRDGGPSGPTRSEASDLVQAWKFQSNLGDFTGTPTVFGGTVVAGTGLGTVYALDAATGNLRWVHSFGVPINGSAAIGDGRVYVPLAKVGSPSVVALDFTNGNLLWQTAIDTQKDSDTFSGPVPFNGKVYIGTSAFFGETTNANVNARGSVVALNAQTGAREWKTFTVPAGSDGGGVWSTPAIDSATHRLFVGTGNAYQAPAAGTTDSMLALDADTGALLGHFQATGADTFNVAGNPVGGPDVDFGASPNLISSGGRQLVGEGQKSGTYWAIDRRTLEHVHRAEQPARRDRSIARWSCRRACETRGQPATARSRPHRAAQSSIGASARNKPRPALVSS